MACFSNMISRETTRGPLQYAADLRFSALFDYGPYLSEIRASQLLFSSCQVNTQLCVFRTTRVGSDCEVPCTERYAYNKDLNKNSPDYSRSCGFPQKTRQCKVTFISEPVGAQRVHQRGTHYVCDTYPVLTLLTNNRIIRTQVP